LGKYALAIFKLGSQALTEVFFTLHQLFYSVQQLSQIIASATGLIQQSSQFMVAPS